ncbi:MBL fold metallo-hydrolase [Nocardia sp. alder85J]|uniref:MBL fold metallo-hydrolase n=1 Tax=Nocardia sp. alder85J TaxID=2862949 RepID=UPI001CD65B45|nr:MBL fold metallo-hydrolase [Nocardia sp. alder85J]MCX4098160.1 MBL fold metallo-hydrolase [Nocardia sp. alder85J]
MTTDIPSATSDSVLDRARWRRPASTRSIRLGELTITYVPDGAVGLKPRGWLPDSTGDDWRAHADHLDERGLLPAGIGGLLVEYGERALLIDAGIGPVAAPDDPANAEIGPIGGGALPDNLAGLGRAAGRIEAVAFTHLHVDHIGWAHRSLPDGSSAFGAAEYLVVQREWDGREPGANGVPATAFDTMAPRLRIVPDGAEIFPGVHAVELAGHTIGHTGFSISSGGQRLLAFGDALHTPLQIRHPHWSAVVDRDPVAAAEVRRRVIDDLADTGDLAFGIHFADVAFGTVTRDGDGVAQWIPLP